MHWNTLVPCQFSGLNSYRRQIESSQVDLLGLSHRTGSPSHACLPLDGEKRLTVKQPGGAKNQPHIPNLSLGYKMWSPNSLAPPPPSVFVFCLPPSASQSGREAWQGHTILQPQGNSLVEWRRCVHFRASSFLPSPSVFLVSGLVRGGGEQLEGRLEEERVRTAFWNPADQSCGILPQRQR